MNGINLVKTDRNKNYGIMELCLLLVVRTRSGHHAIHGLRAHALGLTLTQSTTYNVLLTGEVTGKNVTGTVKVFKKDQ